MSAVGPPEGHARQLLQRRSGNRAEVVPAHLAGGEGAFDGVHVLEIDVFEHGLDRAVMETQQPIADEARDPDSSLVVERESIREASVAERHDRFAPPERAVAREREANQAPAKGFDNVQPRSRGVGSDLVGIVQPVGDDTCPRVVDEHDEAIRDIGAPRRPAAGPVEC